MMEEKIYLLGRYVVGTLVSRAASWSGLVQVSSATNSVNSNAPSPAFFSAAFLLLFPPSLPLPPLKAAKHHGTAALNPFCPAPRRCLLVLSL